VVAVVELLGIRIGKWLKEVDDIDFDVAVLVEKEPDDLDTCSVLQASR
jgi:hypothetical protein